MNNPMLAFPVNNGYVVLRSEIPVLDDDGNRGIKIVFKRYIDRICIINGASLKQKQAYCHYKE